MAFEVKCPKKLIEVALPLDAINAAAAREKSIRHGHPSTLHLWWARRPLAAARAVIFAQLVNDPGYDRVLKRGVNKEEAQKERERLFGIIKRLVQWENINNADLLKEAHFEIQKSWQETCSLNKDHPDAKKLFNPEKIPAFHDPFAGGGGIPIEAQRLGLETYASDLNPVAVTINKAMIEIPSRFSGTKSIGPDDGQDQGEMSFGQSGTSGIAQDVLKYGKWLRDTAYQRIGAQYPGYEVTSKVIKERPDLKPLLGKNLTVIAWVWARTVKSPNPAYSHVFVPLASNFYLSRREGKEAWIQPVIKKDSYSFRVRTDAVDSETESGTKAPGHGANFKCILSGSPISAEYIRAEAQAGRMKSRLLGIVAEADGGRVYLSPDEYQEEAASKANPSWRPDVNFFTQALGFRIGNYGMSKWSDLFSQRQLLALDTFSGLIADVVKKCEKDALNAGFSSDPKSLLEGGTGAKAYAEAIGLYLSCANSKAANLWSSLCFWMNDRGAMRETFARQVLSMVWDYAEANPFSSSGGNYSHFLEKVSMAVGFASANSPGFVSQADASIQSISDSKIICTDPPYFDNIGYADLSDFFYVWMRRGLLPFMRPLFESETVPKMTELVATPARHGGKGKAEKFFLEGMKKTLSNLNQRSHPAYPISIFYAFKQSETKAGEGTSSTGWETFLEAVIQSGFSISGTWPVRTEQSAALKASLNALASSIVLVARRRSSDAPSISRREFLRELNAALPESLVEMTVGKEQSPVAPVDLSQAIIGPGMAIFSRYSAVLEADGNPMTVRTALQLINRFLAEDDFDHDTQFCIGWFDSHGWEKGKFGEADVLARAKGTSVDGLREGGVVESSSGNLKLLRPHELSQGWVPEADSRVSIWELLHQMVKRLNEEGESGAAEILAKSDRFGESIRTLAYRLYTLCERKGWAQDGGVYNSLIIAWESIESAARTSGYSGTQVSLFGDLNAKTAKDLKSKKLTRKKK